MKKLPKYITGRGDVKGIHFEQLKRVGNLCLYERSDGFYEIIEPKEQKASTAVFDGIEVFYQEKEIYPYGESWVGSCVGSLEHANRVFARKLLEKEKNKILKDATT